MKIAKCKEKGELLIRKHGVMKAYSRMIGSMDLVFYSGKMGAK